VDHFVIRGDRVGAILTFLCAPLSSGGILSPWPSAFDRLSMGKKKGKNGGQQSAGAPEKALTSAELDAVGEATSKLAKENAKRLNQAATTSSSTTSTVQSKSATKKSSAYVQVHSDYEVPPTKVQINPTRTVAKQQSSKGANEITMTKKTSSKIDDENLVVVQSGQPVAAPRHANEDGSAGNLQQVLLMAPTTLQRPHKGNLSLCWSIWRPLLTEGEWGTLALVGQVLTLLAFLICYYY